MEGLWRSCAAIADNRPMAERRIRKWSHVAWNDSRAGSLNSPALSGVERKEHPTGIRPSIGSSNKRPQLPGWGRFLDIRNWPLSSGRGGPRDCCCPIATGDGAGRGRGLAAVLSARQMILDIIGYLLAYRRQCPVAYRLFAVGLVELFPRLNAAKSRSVTLVPVTGRSRAGAKARNYS